MGTDTSAERLTTTHPLDIRPVEPKYRYERIMGAYEEMPLEDTLELTVDHDPQCMYYTLRATHGAESFTFDYLENGPERWRVNVRKHRPPPESDEP